MEKISQSLIKMWSYPMKVFDSIRKYSKAGAILITIRTKTTIFLNFVKKFAMKSTT